MVSAIWSAITIMGPLLLVGVVGWVALQNLRPDRHTFERAERQALEARRRIEKDQL